METCRFTLNNKSLSVNIPVSEFDEETRVVSGWATIDNVDQTGDVVTAEASIKAFAEFRGNIREMHDNKKAVGKLLSFEQREFFHADKLYTGIWVKVYISKGAEDTWQKVLDGTLTGFSIGAMVPDTGILVQYVPDLEKSVRFITEYHLIELTLADSPANELCDIVSIHKTLDGEDTVTGILIDVEIENVFWCDNEKIAMVSKAENLSCVNCGDDMEQVGWFEPGEDKASEIRKVLETANKISNSDVTEGGQDMSEREEVTVEETEVVATNEVVEPAEEVDAVTEEVTAEAEVEDVVEASEPDLVGISKALDSIQATLEKSLADGEEREVSLSKVREAVEGVEAKVEKQLQDLLEKHEELANEFTSFKSGLESVEKRLDEYEGSTALRKSADVQDGQEELSKSAKPQSFWKGAFLPTNTDSE